VGFLDIGNVYPTVTDFNPIDVRKAAGIGLRIRTPYVLLRGDLGVKLDRRTGEKLTQFFLSIGQAF
jgi:outer membrane translocation and assembly module TamA